MAVNPLYDGSPTPVETCGTCAWRYLGGPGPRVDRCRRHEDARVSPDWDACGSWTGGLDCQTCGACCREAYHAVEVSRRDPFVRRHPERLVTVEGRLNVRREGDRCACLAATAGQFACTVYADRPRTCREFEQGSANCVDARRRVGLLR